MHKKIKIEMREKINPKNPRPQKSQQPAGMIINLGKNVTLKEIPARSIQADKIEILSITDSSVDKKVTAEIKGILGTVVLWEGAAYDAIGQWTDTEVINRIKELYS